MIVAFYFFKRISIMTA